MNLEKIITVIKALTSAAWFLVAALFILGMYLEIYYASAIEDLAIQNSESILLFMEMAEAHFLDCGEPSY